MLDLKGKVVASNADAAILSLTQYDKDHAQGSAQHTGVASPQTREADPAFKSGRECVVGIG